MSQPPADPPHTDPLHTPLLRRHPLKLALGAGLLSATGFAPLNLWPVSLACFALLIQLIANSRDRRQAFGIGWLFGIGHFTIGLNWIATAFTYQASMPVWLGWIAVVLLSLYLAVYPALVCAGGRAIADRQRPLVLVIALAGLWIVGEWLRSWVFSGFAWNPLGVIAVAIGWPARLVGTYGLSGLVMLAAGSFWLLSLRRWRSGGALTASIVLLSAGSAWALYGVAPTPLSGPAITLVQPNLSQEERLTLEGEMNNIRKLAPLSLPAPQGPPRLLLWPEAAIPDYLRSGYPRRFYAWNMGGSAIGSRMMLTRLLRPGDMLVTGATHLELKGEEPVGARNSVVAMNADGDLVGNYDKAHLVPYGEYLPMKPFLSAIGLARLVPGDIDFWPGPGARTLALPGFGRMGVQICYEIVFSGQVVDPRDRPDYLFNPSTDAWFGAWGPPQHLAQARLRAVEEALPVMRSTPNGISAVIDADGREIGVVELHRPGRIDLILPAARQPTIFSRLGNYAPLIFAALLLLAAIALRRRAV